MDTLVINEVLRIRKDCEGIKSGISGLFILYMQVYIFQKVLLLKIIFEEIRGSAWEWIQHFPLGPSSFPPWWGSDLGNGNKKDASFDRFLSLFVEFCGFKKQLICELYFYINQLFLNISDVLINYLQFSWISMKKYIKYPTSFILDPLRHHLPRTGAIIWWVV